MDKDKITRRAALTCAAALPIAAGLGGAAPARAQDAQGPQVPRVYRVPLGSFEVTAMMAGTRTVPEPQGTFGMNASPEEFAEVSEAAHIPTDKAQFFFTPTLVNTGSALILFDTGLDPAGIVAAVEAAGYTPEDVSHVVITHMHGDHIGGLSEGGVATFANAALITGQDEWDHWSAAGNEGFEGKVRPLESGFSFLTDDAEVAPGITAVLAPGHTPGHMCFALESDGQKMMLTADLANHYVWSVGKPDWEVRFDMDKQLAASSRRKVFGMLAEEKTPFIGYHMPFPAIGYVAAEGDGFRYIPHSYQLLMT
ncbi:MBL fold metallo-hydrolase [Salipiger mangrovisoli]|uniref:MBL fold metallo-hydrolase n=1 Tax=Salipiger mangrovisoli TaxID=2865933 RepID=A0ABR9X206_9RHOB|nr:MBL fold metallo-hydrolase [Salipiger mangrovisoli]MBE9637587.1 MBL fold metallo-hydrolase [Salipiger mangrovisoli]